MHKLQWGLIAVLALGGLGHFAGTLIGYEPGSEIFVWSLTAVCYVFVVAFLQALRLRREQDRWISTGATLATAAWMGLALAFGAAVGDIFDPRGLVHAGASAGLLIATAMGRAGARGSATASQPAASDHQAERAVGG